MATYNGHNEDSSGNILLSIGNGMTATVETGTTASQAYTKGSYLFFNNRLCKATSAISSGATLAIGTNLSQTSIGQEITSHLRSSDGKEFYFDVKDGSYGYYPSASKTASEFVPFGGSIGPVYLNVEMGMSSGTGWVSIFLLASFLKQFTTVTLYATHTGTSVGWGTDYGNSDNPDYGNWHWDTPVQSGRLTVNQSVNLSSLNIAHNMAFAMNVPESGYAGGRFVLKFE